MDKLKAYKIIYIILIYMVKHECPTCKHDFKKKCNLEEHLNKKNKCKPPAETEHGITPKLHEITPKLNENIPIINHELLAQVDIPTCNYCHKTFARKNVVYKHIKESCKVAKQQNKEKQEIFDKLVFDKLVLENKEKQEIIDKLKLENELLEKIKSLEHGTKNLENEIINLKKKIKKVQPITNNNTMNNNTINNIGNTTNNIIVVSYGHEDMSKITAKMLSTACKKGYNSIVHLVETVHFNPIFPEFHNVYIPSVKDKHAMIYYDDTWNLKNKDDIVNDMYDTNRDFIIDNIESINNLLNEGEKRSLNRWLDSEKNKDNSDKDKKAIACTHDNLKLLLHNKRHIPIGTRKQKGAISN